MDEPDRQHALNVIAWFSEAAFNKYSQGAADHGGHLPDKGGLLNEAEAEVLDQAIYLRTLRAQLSRIESWLEQGRVEDALIGLRHIVHGTPLDRLPTD